jgi:(2Fe-2S) ferredoxin
VQTFLGGLDIVRRLRPITFNWRAGGRRDLGFGAEEVEKIDPLLVVYNEKGEVEGVKYKQMTAVLVNAINEQQTQITEQQRTIEQQKLQLEQKDSQIESLKATMAQQESRLGAVESRLNSLVGTRDVDKPSPTSRPNQ